MRGIYYQKGRELNDGVLLLERTIVKLNEVALLLGGTIVE